MLYLAHFEGESIHRNSHGVYRAAWRVLNSNGRTLEKGFASDIREAEKRAKSYITWYCKITRKTGLCYQVVAVEVVG